MVLDAADLTVQNRKVTGALGANVGALSGGGVADTSRDALKGMHYSARRGNAMYTNFNQKLAHDRSVHAMELRALLDATPSNSRVASVLTDLVNMRSENNASRTMHDARMWAEVDAQVGQSLGGGGNAADVLNYGVAQTLSGGGANLDLAGGGMVDSNNYRFGSADAARLWQDVMH